MRWVSVNLKNDILIFPFVQHVTPARVAASYTLIAMQLSALACKVLVGF